MLKKLLFAGLAFLGASCTYVQKTPLCPNVKIQKGNDTLVQKAVGSGQFKIELTGYEGYCFFDDRVNQPKARITPLFRVHRLNNLDESDVHFSYYADTVQGPPQYLGKRFYNESVNLPYGLRQKSFRGRPIESKIPDISGEGYKLVLGLAAAREDNNNHIYNKKQSYAFRYELGADDLRENSGSYTVVTDNYGTEMFYADEAQRQIEAQREAERLAVLEHRDTYRRQMELRAQNQARMRQRIQYYGEPQSYAVSQTQTYSQPRQQAFVREYSAAEIERFPKASVQIASTVPVGSFAKEQPQMTRQMRRRMNCKTCQE